jgi:hypothetical protein
VSVADIQLLGSAERTASLYAATLPQKDNLCGGFIGSIALGAFGVEVDQDEVAAAAGAILPTGGDPAGWLPPGGSPRDDYRLEFERSDDEAITGISAPGLARAMTALGGGALEVTPVAGPFTAASVCELIGIADEADAALVANVATAPFWGSRPTAEQLAAYLATGAGQGPPADWAVGHFVLLAGLLRGAGGSLVIVRDTYGSLGLDGHHVQPPGRMARALEGRGVLVVCRAGATPPLEGFAISIWDNGTPDTAKEG